MESATAQSASAPSGSIWPLLAPNEKSSNQSGFLTITCKRCEQSGLKGIVQQYRVVGGNGRWLIGGNDDLVGHKGEVATIRFGHEAMCNYLSDIPTLTPKLCFNLFI